MFVSTTCLKLKEEEGRAGRKILGNNKQVVCEGSEMGMSAALHRAAANSLSRGP